MEKKYSNILNNMNVTLGNIHKNVAIIASKKMSNGSTANDNSSKNNGSSSNSASGSSSSKSYDEAFSFLASAMLTIAGFVKKFSGTAFIIQLLLDYSKTSKKIKEKYGVDTDKYHDNVPKDQGNQKPPVSKDHPGTNGPLTDEQEDILEKYRNGINKKKKQKGMGDDPHANTTSAKFGNTSVTDGVSIKVGPLDFAEFTNSFGEFDVQVDILKNNAFLAAENIGAAIGSLPENAKAKIEKAAPGFLDGVTDVLNDTSLSAEEKAAKIEGMLGELPPGVREMIEKEGAGFMDGITNTLDDTSLSADEKVALMKEKLTNFPTEVMEALSEDGQNFMQSVDDTLNNSGLSAEEKTALIQEKLTALPESVREELEKADPNFLDKVNSGIDGLKGNAETSAGRVESILTGLPIDIQEELAENCPDFMENVKSVMNNTSMTASQKSAAIESLMAGVPDDIKAKLSKKGGFLDKISKEITAQKDEASTESVSLGKEIPRGVGVGQLAQDALNTALSAAKSVASSIFSSFKNTLGIKSPSRLMRDEVGKQITAGIGVGMEEEMSSVFGSMQRSLNSEIVGLEQGISANANMQAAMLSAAGSTVNTSNNNETINIYQPVKSPAEVARAIRLQRKEMAFE